MDKGASLVNLLKAMVEQGASDLHLTSGVPPCYRINGKITRVKDIFLTPERIQELCHSILSDTQKERFKKTRELDFSFSVKGFARFRANLFYQKGSVAGVFRQIPFQIPEFDSLGLPLSLKRIVRSPNGLVLVTGPTGSGKSTSLASMLDLVNREEYGHIMTIEDPVEFYHEHKKCIVNQREVGSDTKSFKTAFKEILRQDPDFILLGELRDAETAEMALTMAETGHLVFATLHTNSAVQTINRIVSMFPQYQQQHVRSILSFTLQAVVCQQLIEVDGGRAMACELMVPTMAIRNLIRSEKVHQIYSAMQSGQDKSGMQTMNQSLLKLIKKGLLRVDEATMFTTVPDELRRLISGIREDPRAGRKE